MIVSWVEVEERRRAKGRKVTVIGSLYRDEARDFRLMPPHSLCEGDVPRCGMDRE